MGLTHLVHNEPGRFNIVESRYERRRKFYGSIKLQLYFTHASMILQQFRFEKSPPFTGLIRELFRMFISLAKVKACERFGHQSLFKDAMAAKKLKDCRAIIQSIKTAIEMPDWPDRCDKIAVAGFSRGEGAKDRRRLVVANVPVAEHPPAPANTKKRRREGGDNDHLAQPKTSKVKTV